MKIKILSPLWGHEHLELETFLLKIKETGYDGIETGLPHTKDERRLLYDFLDLNEMYIVTHQHAAEGSTFEKFRSSFIKNLYDCAEPGPVLINSHTGRDYFSLTQNLELVDAAQEFSEKTGIIVAHETHRGRLGYSPQTTNEVFGLRPDFRITADISHWVCVTESMLENFAGILKKALERSRHIHTRVGFEQGPQVADPRVPQYKYSLDNFLNWWDEIVTFNAGAGSEIFPMTTEFGPVPYMPADPYTNKPLADQFEINCFMKDLLRERYAQYL